MTIVLPCVEQHTSTTPSDADLKMGKTDHAEQILDISASVVRALNYSSPSSTHDPTLRAAVVEELESWNIGSATNGIMKYLEVGLGAAEVSCTIFEHRDVCLYASKFMYPWHYFDLKVVIAVYTAYAESRISHVPC